MNDPTPTPTGVWLPLPFFNTLLDAYYGAGPLHPSARPYSPPEEEPASPLVGPTPDLPLSDATISTRPRNWVPRGINARTAPSRDEPTSM